MGSNPIGALEMSHTSFYFCLSMTGNIFKVTVVFYNGAQWILFQGLQRYLSVSEIFKFLKYAN